MCCGREEGKASARDEGGCFVGVDLGLSRGRETENEAEAGFPTLCYIAWQKSV